MEKNKGEIRYQITLERIYHCSLGHGQSFTHCVMSELVHYALNGELSESEPTWEPSQEDLDEIDYGKPKGLDVVLKEYQEEIDKEFEGFGWE